VAVCLIALGYCVTSLADDTATMARPGSLSQERLNSAAQNSTDFFVTHGNLLDGLAITQTGGWTSPRMPLQFGGAG
jgi:hypothetical protein